MADLAEIRRILISLINTHPNGIPEYRFDIEYLTMVGTKIPFADYSYINLVQFLSAELKDNIRIEVKPMDVWLFPIINAKSGHIIKMIQEQVTSKNKVGRIRYSQQSKSMEQDEKVKVQTKLRSPTMPNLIEYKPLKNQRVTEQVMVKNTLLQSLLPNSNNRADIIQKISRSEKLQKFRIKCSEVKNKERQSWSQVEPQVPLQEAKPTLTPLTQQDFEWESSKENVWDPEDLEPPRINSNKTNSNSYYCVSDGSELLQELLSHDMTEHFWPKNHDVEKNEVEEMTSILDELHIGNVVTAKLSDVNNIFEFWIHLRHQKRLNEQFNTMYREMQEYYDRNRHCESLKVHNLDARYFALYYYKQWHRVEPLDKMGESLKVSFVDHGTCVYINMSELRKLPKWFVKIPKAAVCCSLGYIKPTGRKNSSRTKAFTDLVDEGKFYAKILDIDKEQSKAIVEIILKSNKKCVNDELVRLGLAMPEER